MAQHTDDLNSRKYSLPDGRAVITRRVNAPPSVVWSVLADGWMYATWVVGAARVRLVEPDWPNRGSRLHHSSGVWPALVNDHTEIPSPPTEGEYYGYAPAVGPREMPPCGSASHLAACRTAARCALSRTPPAVPGTCSPAPPGNC